MDLFLVAAVVVVVAVVVRGLRTREPELKVLPVLSAAVFLRPFSVSKRSLRVHTRAIAALQHSSYSQALSRRDSYPWIEPQLSH